MNWISVNEKMPDKNGFYVGLCGSQIQILNWFSDEDGPGFRYLGCNTIFGHAPTHWIEFPAPPHTDKQLPNSQETS